jgi:UDP-3-O-[3-hydroxymyristoyl] glucosamine N-acyltransferase
VISKIDSSAKIHPTAWINPNNVIIEKRVEVGPNSCIGTQAIVAPREYILFGKRKLDESKGQVIIKEDVNIGALNSINLAQKEGSSTLIEKNVISGSCNIVGHDSVIGEQTIITGNVTMEGFVTIGKRCRLGPGAIIRKMSIGSWSNNPK